MAQAVRRNILESADYIAAGGRVVRVRTDAAISGSLAVPKKVKELALLENLVVEWGIDRQVTRLLKTFNIVR
jgi:hypothetical protein